MRRDLFKREGGFDAKGEDPLFGLVAQFFYCLGVANSAAYEHQRTAGQCGRSARIAALVGGVSDDGEAVGFGQLDCLATDSAGCSRHRDRPAGGYLHGIVHF